MKTYTTNDFKRWGAEGGRKSRRVLTTEQAIAMNRAKARKRKLRMKETKR